MEIHRSSLIYSPHGNAHNQIGKPASTQKQIENNLKPDSNTAQQIKQSFPETILKPEQIEARLERNSRKLLSQNANSTIPDQPVNKHIQKALNAYNQELNQALQNHHDDLITGIDFLV